MKLLTRLWQRLASLTLSVWLLTLSALLMLVHSKLAHSRSQLYHALNTTPIWAWLRQTWSQDPLVFWLITAMIAILAVLALNTVACTVTRLIDLLGRKESGRGFTAKLTAWAPTLMHCLFFLILAGHMATFTFGQWRPLSVRQGQTLELGSGSPPLVVTGIQRLVRVREGLLRGSTLAHEVAVRIGDRQATLRELEPLRLGGGKWLLLLPPQRKGGRESQTAPLPLDCSGEERHVQPIPFSPDQQIQLKLVSDPGVLVLLTGLSLILLLMIGHYAFSWWRK